MNEVQINFTNWLIDNGYAFSTIDAYPYWIESRVIRAFNIPNIQNLLEIQDIKLLETLEPTYMMRELTKTEQDLRSALRKFIEFNKFQQNIDNKQIESDLAYQAHLSFTEGGKKVVISTRVERNKKLREEAIKIHKLSCQVCNFNFEEKYGKHGKDFIEVHHVVPLSKYYNPKIINPETDLKVVCSNCHRMIHRKKEITLSIDELKSKLTNSK